VERERRKLRWGKVGEGQRTVRGEGGEVKRLRSNWCVGLTVKIGRRKDVRSGLIQLRFIFCSSAFRCTFSPVCEPHGRNEFWIRGRASHGPL